MQLSPHQRGDWEDADLATVPWYLLVLILGTMVVQVRHKVQPDHVDPVGHEVQVEHVQGPQCNRGDSEDGQHALQEGVGGLDLHAEQQASAPCTEQQTIV